MHAVNRLLAALDAAASAAGFAYAGTAARARRGRDFRVLFARLGHPLPEVEAMAAAQSSAELPAPLRAGLSTRLDAERRRLARLARAGSAAYDLNRHLAVRAAARWLAEAAGPVPEGAA